MNDIIALIVPAVAALSGVALSQFWSSRRDTGRARELAREQAVADCRSAMLEYLIALNRAIGHTRDHVKALIQSGEIGQHVVDYGAQEELADHPERHPEAGVVDASDADAVNHQWWAAAFDAFLAIEFVLPEPGINMARKHLDDAFAWRRRCFRRGGLLPEPNHRDLLADLGPWLGRRDVHASNGDS